MGRGMKMTVNKEDFKNAIKGAKDIGKSGDKKKVLKITANKKSEFLFAYDNKSVATCKNIKDAVDIAQFTFDQISFLISNLKRVGYQTEVVEVKA
jgi:hypothetical protein